MADPHVITALVKKRAGLSGEAEKLDERRLALKQHLANIDAVLRLFRFTGDPAAIKPKRKRNWMFPARQASADGRRYSQSDRPMHKEEIAAEIVNRKGWAPDPDLVETVADKVKDVRKRLANTTGL